MVPANVLCILKKVMIHYGEVLMEIEITPALRQKFTQYKVRVPAAEEGAWEMAKSVRWLYKRMQATDSGRWNYDSFADAVDWDPDFAARVIRLGGSASEDQIARVRAWVEATPVSQSPSIDDKRVYLVIHFNSLGEASVYSMFPSVEEAEKYAKANAEPESRLTVYAPVVTYETEVKVIRTNHS